MFKIIKTVGSVVIGAGVAQFLTTLIDSNTIKPRGIKGLLFKLGASCVIGYVLSKVTDDFKSTIDETEKEFNKMNDEFKTI